MPLDILVAPTTSRSSFSGGPSRFLAVLLVASISVCAQQSATLHIRLLDSSKLYQSLSGSGKSSLIIVVEDSTGNPVPQAAVSFRLPDDGPTGVFANGLRSEIAITGADGRGAVAPIHWAGVEGRVPLRVTAAKGQLRAGVVLELEVSAAVTEVGRISAHSHKPAASPDLARKPVISQPVEVSAQSVPAVRDAPLGIGSYGPPLVRGASVAVGTNTNVPVDLQTPKYDPPGFWKSKWFLIILAGGGVAAAGYAATKFRKPGSASNPYAIVPGDIAQVPVVIGPPSISVGKP